MKEKPVKKSSQSLKFKNHINFRLNEKQADQWHEMLMASGKKEADLIKGILFKKTLTVKQVDNSTENLIIQVSRMVTELRSLRRKLNDKSNPVEKEMTEKLNTTLQETEKIVEKVFQKWWQDTQ